MSYLPPHKRSGNQFAVLADSALPALAVNSPAPLPAKKSTYVPPSQRVVDPLDPANFPSLGKPAVSTPPTAPSLNFLTRIKEAEEERQRAQEEALSYDPAKLDLLTHTQLRKEGWEVLSLKRPSQPGFAAEFNALASKPIVEEFEFPPLRIRAPPRASYDEFNEDDGDYISPLSVEYEDEYEEEDERADYW